VREPGALERRVRRVADGAPRSIEQKDVFFATRQGRLKLRTFADGSGELIRYDRVDRTGPTESSYDLAGVADCATLETVLARALGVRGVVRKQRRLFMVGRTRIHLDRVEGLGEFVELEVVLEPSEPRERGVEITTELMRMLGIEPEDLVDGAYVDLLGCGPDPAARPEEVRR